MFFFVFFFFSFHFYFRSFHFASIFCIFAQFIGCHCTVGTWYITACCRYFSLLCDKWDLCQRISIVLLLWFSFCLFSFPISWNWFKNFCSRTEQHKWFPSMKVVTNILFSRWIQYQPILSLCWAAQPIPLWHFRPTFLHLQFNSNQIFPHRWLHFWLSANVFAVHVFHICAPYVCTKFNRNAKNRSASISILISYFVHKHTTRHKDSQRQVQTHSHVSCQMNCMCWKSIFWLHNVSIGCRC